MHASSYLLLDALVSIYLDAETENIARTRRTETDGGGEAEVGGGIIRHLFSFSS
jgi:hypothetical protein